MDIIPKFLHLEVTSFNPEGLNSIKVPLSYNYLLGKQEADCTL